MRVALVNAVPVKGIYSVALLKLGAMLQGQGYETTYYSGRLPAKGDADAIWLTTLFTYDIPRSLSMAIEAQNRAPEVKVGGIAASLLPEHFEDRGIEAHRGLVLEAEECAPAYDLLSKMPEFSITHTSRGCIRRCAFCMVKNLEPEFISRDWERDLCPGADRVLFYDNNWLAKDFDDWLEDVQAIRGMVRRGKLREVDFNQGLDCRLLTDDHAEAMKALPIRPVRFAFDGMHEDGYFQRAVEAMAKRGHRNFGVYVLYNFKDTPEEFYYRMRECIRLQSMVGIDVHGFPMRYHSIGEADKGRQYIGEHWTKAQRTGFMTLLSLHSRCGQLSAKSMAEFEFWFGKDAKEFAALIAYPRVRELGARKKGALRIARAQGRLPWQSEPVA